MAAETTSFEEFTSQAMRDFALSRSASVAKYGDLLSRFGKGEIAATSFSEQAIRLALEDSARYAQDAVKLGSAYLTFLSKLTRAADVSAATRAAKRASPAESARKRRRASRTA